MVRGRTAFAGLILLLCQAVTVPAQQNFTADVATPAGTLASGPGQMVNISARAFVQSGDRVMIGGFILRGAIAKRVLVRGIGPTLSEYGVADALSDPRLELRDQNGNLLVANDNWKETQQAEIEATGLAPRYDTESAILVDLLAPGAYTAILRGRGAETGVALVNLSTRAFVGTGERVLIGGFILGGADGMGRVIARGLGPSLARFGISDPLADPALELRSGNGTLLASNNNWKDTQQSVIEATGLAPANDREAAIVAELPAGAYTAILRGADGGTGTGLVELYDLNTAGTPVARFSFENGLEGWVPKATDVSQPPVPWVVERSQDRATDGSSSMRVAVDNLTDAAKVWGERVFQVRPNRAYRVNVQFSFASADFGGLNEWRIITGVRTSPAERREDLTYQGSTGNGSGTNVGYVWMQKSYDFEVTAGNDGKLYVDIGVWGTWETFRAYYFDDVRITIAER